MRVTEILVILCVLVFFGQMLLGPAFESNFVLRGVDLLDKPWLVLTSMFAHGDLQHLFFNMFALFIFGGALENRLGKGNYLLLYLVSGVVGGIGFMLLGSPFGSGLGASGAIYGIIGALALLIPNMRIYLMGVPMPMYVAGFVYAFIEIVGLGATDGIAHSAHLLGLFGGLGIAFWLKDRLEDLDIARVVVVGVGLALVTGVSFGAFYAMDEVNMKVSACEDREISAVSDVAEIAFCLEGLSEEYKNEPGRKEVICDEYAKFAYYVSDSSYSSLRERCIGDG